MKTPIAQVKIKEPRLKRGQTDDSPSTPLQQRGICKIYESQAKFLDKMRSHFLTKYFNRVPNLHPEFIGVVKRSPRSPIGLCYAISRYRETAMTALVQELLDTFDRLTDSERLDLVLEMPIDTQLTKNKNPLR